MTVNITRKLTINYLRCEVCIPQHHREGSSTPGPAPPKPQAADPPENPPSTPAQHADDTTMHDNRKNGEIKSCAQNLQKDLNNLSPWSTNENPLFNEDKTKSILSSTSQLAQKHQLSDSNTYQIKCNEKAVKRVQCTKLLGIHFDENLSWKDHVNNVVKSCYGTLRILRQFKRFTPLNVRKTLAETLIAYNEHKIQLQVIRPKQIRTYGRCN